MANYLIISASSDIGYETAAILRAKGHKIFITCRQEEKLEILKNKFECEGAILDATNFAEVENVFDIAIKNLGSLEGVVSFSGSVILKPAHLTSEADFLATINANLTTAFGVVRAAGKFMKNGGSVVLLSSAAAMQGLANHEAIAAAKGGIISLAKSAAATYAGQNLRFNVVAPGLTKTKLTQKITSNEASLKFSQSMHALGRIGESNEVAGAVEFFLDEKSSWITAQVLGVDGGLSNVQPKK
jgi:NAD(P)-dependent dehydrogenase (short-subunit alcohol dehydrogenase family)